MLQNEFDAPKAIAILERTKKMLAELPEFKHELMEPPLRALAEELGFKPGPLFGVIRIAVTGKKVTPPLFESIAVLGKDKTLARIDEAMVELRAQ